MLRPLILIANECKIPKKFKGRFCSEGAGEMLKHQTQKPNIFLKLRIAIFLHLSD